LRRIATRHERSLAAFFEVGRIIFFGAGGMPLDSGQEDAGRVDQGTRVAAQIKVAGLASSSQGDPADSVFYIQDGKVKVCVISEQGKEAVVALHGKGDFFGEGCLTGQPLRLATVAAMTDCVIMRLDKAAIVRVLHNEPKFDEMFMSYLLARNARVEEDLVDQLFNSSEKRLARMLLLMANFGKEGRPEPVMWVK
jgi:CRP/FNR family cyclic AMP-dependent transcriptional regulator